MGEPVSIAPRTSLAVKRDHKFRLNNEKTGQSIKAMVISYNEEPLTIVNSFKYSYIEYNYWIIFDQFVPKTVFAKDIILSDGTEWTVHDHLDKFVVGAEVYVSNPENSGNSQPFMIIGKEREAIWVFK